MTKYCKDCKWCSYKEPTGLKKIFPFLVRVDDYLEYAHCLHQSARISKTVLYDHLVTGEQPKLRPYDYSYCGTMRSLNSDTFNCCGTEGKHWEPR